MITIDEFLSSKSQEIRDEFLHTADDAEISDWYATASDEDKQRFVAQLALPAAETATGSAKRFVQRFNHSDTPKLSDQLLADVLVKYDVIQERAGIAAVPVGGPRVIVGSTALSRLLSAAALDLNGATAESVISTAVSSLAGLATSEVSNPQYRYGKASDGSVVIDLGAPLKRSHPPTDTQVIIIEPDGTIGTALSGSTDVVFRRHSGMHELDADMRTPVTLVSALLEHTTLTCPNQAALVIAWLVSLILQRQTPILLLEGLQGAGKTTTGERLISLIDPSAAMVRSFSPDVESLSLQAESAVAFVADNISRISPSMQDILCQTVTGSAHLKRTLYTDSELTISDFQCGLILTSIDPGRVRNDLAERTLRVELTRPREGFASATRLKESWQLAQPAITGSLIKLAGKVLAELNNRPPETSAERMADFAEIVAVVDSLLPACSVMVYEGPIEVSVKLPDGSIKQLDSCPGDEDDYVPLLVQPCGADAMRRNAEMASEDAVESDVVASAVLEMLEARQEWQGTFKELREALSEYADDYAWWPKNAQQMSGELKRAEVALSERGVVIDRSARIGDARSRGVHLSVAL